MFPRMTLIQSQAASCILTRLPWGTANIGCFFLLLSAPASCAGGSIVYAGANEFFHAMVLSSLQINCCFFLSLQLFFELLKIIKSLLVTSHSWPIGLTHWVLGIPGILNRRAPNLQWIISWGYQISHIRDVWFPRFQNNNHQLLIPKPTRGSAKSRTSIQQNKDH